ncbi:MAG: TolC family protein [Deltaproteobacteria bacterium]|nr:TolC family protein [Deltaproteobacteria bacterium]
MSTNRLFAVAPAAFGLALTCCYHPLVAGDSQQRLQTLESFDHSTKVADKPVPLADVPLEPKESIHEQARKMFVAGDQKPEGRELTIAEVRKSILENNLGLRVDRYGPEIAGETYEAAAWKFEPRLGATASYTKDFDAAGDPAKTIFIEPSLRVPTRLGGDVTLSLPYSARDSDQKTIFGPGGPVAEGKTKTPGLTISLSQPLLRNAWLSVNYASINLAGLRARQADARMKLATIRALALGEQTYWRYYAAYESLRIQVQRYDLAKEQLRFAIRLVEEGVRNKIEVTRAASGVALEFEGVIRSELERRRGERALKRVLNIPGLGVDSATVIHPATPPSPVGLTFNRATIMELALASRMDLFENELQVAVDETTETLLGNQVLPDVSFTFAYSFSGARPELSDAIDRLVEDDLNKLTASLRIDLPLVADQAARALWRQSILTKSQTLARRKDLTQAVQQEVMNAVDAVEQTWQRILANRQAVALAQETYDAEKTQFAYGQTTSTEVLRALGSLALARQAFAQASSDYHNTMVDLAFATGTILSETGVKWPELGPSE